MHVQIEFSRFMNNSAANHDFLAQNIDSKDQQYLAKE